MLVIHAGSWWAVRRQLQAGYQDFSIFYTAGKILSRGEGAHLYDNSLQYRTQREFTSRVTVRNAPLPYNHIPAEALVLVPFAQLPYFQAYLLWDVFNMAALAGALFVLRQHLSALRAQPTLLWFLLGLAFFPVFLALLQGQDVLLSLLAFALVYSAMRRNASFLAGWWLGVGLFRFSLVLPFVVILALRKRWRALAGFAVAAAMMAVASAAVVGWKQALLYPAYVLKVERTSIGPIAPQDMPNLRGLVETALSHGVGGHFLARGIIAVLSLALLWFCSTCRDSNEGSSEFDLSFSLAIIAAVLASYHTYVHGLSILLIPVLLVANHCLACARRRGRWTLLAPICMLFLTPLYFVLLFRMQVACLLSIALLAWFWGISQEIRRLANVTDPPLGSAP